MTGNLIPLAAALQTWIVYNNVYLFVTPARDLVKQAQKGCPLSGRRSPSAELEAIPLQDWQHCSIDPPEMETLYKMLTLYRYDEAEGISFSADASARWRDLRLTQEDLQKWFPRRPVVVMPWEKPKPPHKKSRRPYHSKRTRIKKVLQDLYSDNPLHTRTAAQVHRAVQKKIPDAKRDTVNRALGDLGWCKSTQI